MELDLFTLAAQIFNFLVLVFILKFFLWGKIISAIENRKKAIQDNIEEAENRKREAENESSSYREKQRELDERRDRIIAQAREEAEKEKKQLIERYKSDAREKRRRWISAIEEDKAAFRKKLVEMSGREVIRISRKICSEIADTDVERRIIDLFIDKLEHSDDDIKEKLRIGGNGTKSKPVLVTAFTLDKEKKSHISSKLDQILNMSDISFKTDDSLIAGIELRVDGTSISWNMKQYIENMASKLEKMLDSKIESTE